MQRGSSVDKRQLSPIERKAARGQKERRRLVSMLTVRSNAGHVCCLTTAVSRPTLAAGRWATVCCSTLKSAKVSAVLKVCLRIHISRRAKAGDVLFPLSPPFSPLSTCLSMRLHPVSFSTFTATLARVLVTLLVASTTLQAQPIVRRMETGMGEPNDMVELENLQGRAATPIQETNPVGFSACVTLHPLNPISSCQDVKAEKGPTKEFITLIKRFFSSWDAYLVDRKHRTAQVTALQENAVLSSVEGQAGIGRRAEERIL